ncbi:MAG: protein YgfX [Candidatus Thiodiazotropha sp. (ex. Lucinoma kazani)]
MSGKIQAVTLLPTPSRQLYIWQLTTHALALLVTLFAPLILIHKLLLLLLLAIYILYSQRQSQRTNRKHILKVRIEPDGRSRLTMGDGRRLIAKVRSDSVITPWLILLRFNLKQGWFHPTMVLFEDALPHEQMRQLRVLLKFGGINQEDG